MILIKDLSDIDKILSFIRVNSKGSFSIPEDLRSELIKKILDWSKKHSVSVSFVKPNGEKIAAYTAVGAATGILLGAVFLPLSPIFGAVIGGMGGGLTGYAAAHLMIEVASDQNDNMAMITIL